MKAGQGVLNCLQQRLEGPGLHPALGQRHGHDITVTPQLGHQVHLLLDAVEREAHPALNAPGAHQLRLKSGLAHGSVRMVAEAPQLGQGALLPVYRGAGKGGEVAPQICPGAARAPLHPGQKPLCRRIQKVPALFCLLLDVEAVVGQNGVRRPVLLGEFQLPHPAAHQGRLPRYAAKYRLETAHGVHRLAVTGVGLAAHLGKLLQIRSDAPHLLLARQQRRQRRRVQPFPFMDLPPIAGHQFLQTGDICGKGRIVKSLI